MAKREWEQKDRNFGPHHLDAWIPRWPVEYRVLCTSIQLIYNIQDPGLARAVKVKYFIQLSTV